MLTLTKLASVVPHGSAIGAEAFTLNVVCGMSNYGYI